MCDPDLFIHAMRRDSSFGPFHHVDRIFRSCYDDPVPKEAEHEKDHPGSWNVRYHMWTMCVAPGSSHYVRYYDFGATICDVTPGALEFAASASGVLTGSGDELAGTLPVYCQYRPPEYWGDHYFQFTYDASTDTLSDGSIVWYRR